MKDNLIRLHVGPKSKSIIARDKKVISPSLTREYSFVFKTGKGSTVWDADGKKYIDFASSVAVMNTGYGNKQVEKAIIEQAKQGIHCGFADFFAEKPVELAETLLKLVPKGFEKVFFANSGAETIESAIKCAKWHTKKKWFIAFNPCFHGRTMGALSLTLSNPKHRERFGPFLPVKHSPYPYLYRSRFDNEEELSDYCLSELEKTIRSTRGNTAGIMLEPIAGEAGYIPATKQFVKGLRKACTQHGIVFCDDEIQAGNYRTGKYLAIEHYKVKPDIVCISKAIGGGLPLGAMVASSRTMNWTAGTHASTFGGNLLACAAGKATLDFMKKNRLGEKAEKTGKKIMKRLKETMETSRIIGDVRGKGLMIGIEIVKSKKTKAFGTEERKTILKKAAQKGLLLLPAGKSTIRIAPPLIITEKQAMEGINILEESIKETEKGKK